MKKEKLESVSPEESIRQKVEDAISAFVKSGAGRVYYPTYNIDRYDPEIAKVSIAIIEGEVEHSSLDRLEAMFRFLNDFPQEFGGTYLGLLNPGENIQNLRRALINRLLKERVKSQIFENLLARATGNPGNPLPVLFRTSRVKAQLNRVLEEI